ncbi:MULTISPECIES: hypothetical protein [unclassified Streptomyces]|uniref:hypothetical protein n=1 Tax=unclassified Streptomyces TaxID=2593676 RepID=UPI0033A0E975
MDRTTAMADARTALCLAAGVDIEDIDPASGYDISRHAYERSRRSWIDHMKQEGLSYFYIRPHLEEVIAQWAKRRPQYTAGDDWESEAVEAHRLFWQERGGPCRHRDCLLHDPGNLRFEAHYRDEAGVERAAVWTTGDPHAVLRGPDGDEVGRVAMPPGADEFCALSVITDTWGEDLTDWRHVGQAETGGPGAPETPHGVCDVAESVSQPEDSGRLF